MIYNLYIIIDNNIKDIYDVRYFVIIIFSCDKKSEKFFKNHLKKRGIGV